MRPNQEVKEIRKAGRIDEAYKRALELLGEDPDDVYLKGALGWVLYDKLKLLREREQRHKGSTRALSDDVLSLMREYAGLELRRPDLLFSFLIIQLIGFDTVFDWFPRLLEWAQGLEAFRREDFAPTKREDGDPYEALVVRVAVALAKAAESTETLEDDKFALDFIDGVLENAEPREEKWLSYHKVLLLKGLGRSEEAEPIMLRFVQNNSQDPFAWHVLALVEEKQNPENALALCASAVVRVGKPEFGLKILYDLARLAVEAGRFSLARWAVEECLKIRNERGYKIPENLQNLARSQWFKNAKECGDAETELESLAHAATSFVYRDLPSQRANFIEIFTSKGGHKFASFSVSTDTGHSCVVFPERDIQRAGDLQTGTPVSLKILKVAGRESLIEINSREDGKLFDCIESRAGVVEHRNDEKHVTAVYVSPNCTVVLHHDRVPAAGMLSEGEFVRVFVTQDGDRFYGVAVERTEPFDSDHIGVVKGLFRSNPKGFGFVDPDIFVPAQLASLIEGDAEVTVLAIQAMDRKKERLGWKAVSLVGQQGN